MLKKDYFEWLTDIIGGYYQYRKLLELLLDIDYVWFIKFDDDRVQDCLDLRKTYAKLIDEPDDLGLGGAKVLELIMSLAISCEDNIMHDRDFGDRTPDWFWMMIGNLGLLDPKFDDDFIAGNEDEVYKIINKMLYREYENDGVGSLFPLVKSVTDFSSLDLWRQLNQFLLQKFEF